MFGFSLAKLLVLGLILLVLWQVFKWIGTRAALAARARSDSMGRDGKASPAIPDLVSCPLCGAYATPETRDCVSGRTDCPRLGGPGGNP